jgi:hypothetical protein
MIWGFLVSLPSSAKILIVFILTVSNITTNNQRIWQAVQKNRHKPLRWIISSYFVIVVSIVLFCSMLSIDILLLYGSPQPITALQTALNATTLPSSHNISTTRTDFSTYKNTTYGIKIQYPSTWKANENLSSNGRNINIVKFVSSLPGNPTLVVSRDRVSPNDTVDLYLAEIVQDLKPDVNHPGFTLISTDTKDTQLAGNAGYELLYSNRDPSSDNIVLNDEIGTVIGDKVYYVTYTAAEPQYSTYKPAINQMIDSLIIYVTNGTKSTAQPTPSIAGVPIDPGDIAET